MPGSNKLTGIVAGVFRFWSGMLRSLYSPSRYAIKRGYIHRGEVVLHDDLDRKDEYQKAVYETAARLMADQGWQHIMDIGCGSGYKLVQYLGAYKTLGIDLPSTIDRVRAIYPGRQWLSSTDFDPAAHETDLIICADVLEHVANPDTFLQHILGTRGWKRILISTPERNLRRGWFHYGPPPNPAHYREWSRSELLRFLSPYLKILSAEIVDHQHQTLLVTAEPVHTNHS